MLSMQNQFDSTGDASQTVASSEVPASGAEKALLFLVMGLVLLVDYLSKRFIEGWLPLNHSWMPWSWLAPYFQISHVTNTGAAFGLFPSGSMLFAVVAIIVSVVIVIYNFRLPGNQIWFRVALGLELGGAIGNLIDRFRLGHVTDFLDFGPWPVFNLADLSIVLGVILMAYLMISESWREQKRASANEASAAAKDSGETGTSDDRNMLLNE
jgi:signal peptidase II